MNTAFYAEINKAWLDHYAKDPLTMKAYEMPLHLEAIQAIAEDISTWAEVKGFWKPLLVTQDADASGRTVPDFIKEIALLQKSTKLMLVVTELAECVEGLRKPPGDTLAGPFITFSNEEEEIADAIIRLLDYAGHYKLRIGLAIGAKMSKNEGRPYMHNKNF